ncbi:MAG: dihydropteroate synthase [Solirubrobacterales bacterium]|nr:dihydropteroate synthase [Solirubrobacterales bacterium]
MNDELLERSLREHLGLVPRPRWHPYLMGIVNATPDSFSDAPGKKSLEDCVELARKLIADGADIIDVGGESGVTNKPAVDAVEEIARVAPVIEAISALPGSVVSVDTYKPAVARAAIAAGARIVNDVSGLADDDLAAAAAEGDAAIVLMHTRAKPKEKRFPDYDDVVADINEFLADAISRAVAQGVPVDRVIVDPGPDFAKTPAQTIASLRALETLAELGRPILLAAGRKDFIGALTDRGPREREAGTLAALAAGVDHGIAVARLHDVAAATDFLTVRAALSGELAVDDDLALDESKRRVELVAEA